MPAFLWFAMWVSYTLRKKKQKKNCAGVGHPLNVGVSDTCILPDFMKRVTITLPEEDAEALRAEAARDGNRGMGSIVRAALSTYLPTLITTKATRRKPVPTRKAS